ncbi:MAG: hypothetical protein HOV80_34735 [Polyangiaceae bacterium]|nr:hypothetical protein [Polyangiaceae bacterium]
MKARVVVSIAVVVALLLPIWLVGLPPLSDYINHLARAQVLAHLGENAAYRDAYASAWGPYPNLAFDIFAVPLASVLDVVLVGKLFLSVTVLVWCAGCHALGHAALGRGSWRAPIACFFVMCEPFLLGYANFTFGMGVALLATACLLRSRSGSRTRWLVIAAALGLVAAVSHAAAIVTFCMVAACFGLSRVRDGLRDAIAEGAVAIPGGLYFSFWLVSQADHSKDRSWASPGTSLRALATSITPSYEPWADPIVLAGLALAAGLALYFARPLRPNLALALSGALCAVAVFIAPADFGGSYEANGRYALGAWVMTLFAIRPDEAKLRRLAAPAAIALAALFGRQALVTRAWMRLGTELEAERAVLRTLPERAVLANVTFLDPRAPRSARLRELALLHAPAFAVIDREATLPTLYAIPGVQPIAHKRPLYDAHRFKTGEIDRVDVERLETEMDAVWLCRAPDELVAKLGKVTELGRSGDCVLVRIER